MRNVSLVALLALLVPSCGESDPPICGDSVKNGNDVCDGPDVAGASCESLGFGAGTLACKPGCGDFDRAGCGAPTGCGDGTLATPEVCDGSLLAGTTCESLGFGPGTLTCRPNCADFDTSACGAPPTCNNGQKDGTEVCDGAALGGATCTSLNFDGGTLACAANCMALDTSGCTKQCTPQCDSRVCGPDPVCGTSCGSCDSQSSCDASGQCVQICDLPPIQTNTTLNLDLEVVTVTGTVTVNGQPMPTDPSNNTRGYLRFIEASTGDYTSVDLGPGGAASYSVQLFVGTYDVQFSDGTYQTVLPQVRTGLATELSIQQNMTKDFDLKVLTVSGTVTVNGQPMPTEPSNNTRGYLRFIDRSTGDYTSADLGQSGPGAYSVKVFAGTHEVQFSDGTYQTVLPQVRTRLDQGLSLQQSMTKNFDLKVVTISGTVTVNGQPMPNEPSNNTRGYLRFIDQSTGDYTLADLGQSGPGAYSVKIFAGTHDIQFSDGTYQTVLPQVRTQLDQGLSLQQSTTKSYDLKTATITGSVTVNGKPMPDDPSNNTRGYLRFIDLSTGDYTSAELFAAGPANYNVKLFAGTHDVQFSDGTYQTVLPNVRTRLDKSLSLQQSTTKSYDLKTATITGSVTINGQTMPADPSNNTRGYLRFTDRSTGDYTSADLGPAGAASYSVQVFTGTHDVVFSDGTYQTVLPQVRTLVQRNLVVQQSSKQDYDLKVVTVSGAVTVNGKPMPADPSNNTRGYLRFANRLEGDYTSVDLGATGAASYSVKLFATSYDVEFSDGTYQTVLPQLRTRLRTGCFDLGGCSASKTDVSGSWYLVPSMAYWAPVDLTLLQQGTGVSGTWYSSGISGLLDSGSLSGDSLTFSFTSTCTVAVQAQLQSGCLMVGSMQASNCATTSPYSQFVGTRLP